MLKSTRKFLYKALDKDSARTELDWIHIVALRDERVFLSADGFKLHLDWSVDTEKHLTLDECWVIPTSRSREWEAKHTRFHNKLEGLIDTQTTMHNKCQIEFAPYAFQQTIKHFPHEAIFIHVTPDRQVFFAHDDVIFKVGTLSMTMETPLEETHVFVISKTLIKQSYKFVETTMVIDLSNPDAPVQLGVWGERLAILMPMSINYAGSPKGLCSLVDDVADLLSDAEQSEESPIETEAF